jgi:RNA polymerase sigma-32 factor
MTVTSPTTDPRPSVQDGVGRYLRSIRLYPLLTPEDERRLATELAEKGSVEARDQLITSHLRLVAKIAAGYRGYGLPIGELISAGNVGLMQAVDKFDVSKGFRLATYAMWWIRASMQEYILQSWSIVRMGSTSQQKKLFFNLRRLKGQLQAFDDGELSARNVKTIAERLNVPDGDVIKMNRRMAGPDYSLNAPVRDEGEGQRQDWLVDDADNQETTLAELDERSYRRALLGQAMSTLSERERDILVERRLAEKPLTLEQLGFRYGISRERVRQIEGIAVDKLTKSVDKAAKSAEANNRFARPADHIAGALTAA